MSNVLITGANRGIGLAFCQHYKSLGVNVIAVCRRPSAALQELGVEIIDSIDVSSDQCVADLGSIMHGRSIDILVNNAGILRAESIAALDFSQIRDQFEVNTLGPLRVVSALSDCLIKGSKIALITSRMGSIEDNTSGGYYGYRISKCGLNAAGKSMAIDLKPKGIAVALLHPGYVQTEMVNFGGDISPALAVQRLAARIGELNLENSGSFWHSNGELLPW